MKIETGEIPFHSPTFLPATSSAIVTQIEMWNLSGNLPRPLDDFLLLLLASVRAFLENSRVHKNLSTPELSTYESTCETYIEENTQREII